MHYLLPKQVQSPSDHQWIPFHGKWVSLFHPLKEIKDTQETILCRILEKIKIFLMLTNHLQLQRNKLVMDLMLLLIQKLFQDGLSLKETILFQILELIKKLKMPQIILSGLKKMLDTHGLQNSIQIKDTGRTCQLSQPIPHMSTNHSQSHLQRIQMLPELQTEMIENYDFNYNYLSSRTISFYL